MSRRLAIGFLTIIMLVTAICSCAVTDDANHILDSLLKAMARADSLERVSVVTLRNIQRGSYFLRSQSSAYEVAIDRLNDEFSSAIVYQADLKRRESFTTWFYAGKEPEHTKNNKLTGTIDDYLWNVLLFDREFLKEVTLGDKKSLYGSCWQTVVGKCDLHYIDKRKDVNTSNGSFELLISPDFQKWIELYTAEDGKYIAVQLGTLGSNFELPQLEFSSEVDIEQYISGKLRQTVIWEMPIGEWLK
jgi:hypothetical protein